MASLFVFYCHENIFEIIIVLEEKIQNKYFACRIITLKLKINNSYMGISKALARQRNKRFLKPKTNGSVCYGEILKNIPLHIKIIPGAIKVLVPKKEDKVIE